MNYNIGFNKPHADIKSSLKGSLIKNLANELQNELRYMTNKFLVFVLLISVFAFGLAIALETNDRVNINSNFRGGKLSSEEDLASVEERRTPTNNERMLEDLTTPAKSVAIIKPMNTANVTTANSPVDATTGQDYTLEEIAAMEAEESTVPGCKIVRNCAWMFRPGLGKVYHCVPQLVCK